mgnify:FL=1
MQMKNVVVVNVVVVKAVKALILPLILVLLVNLTGCSEEKSDMVLDVQEVNIAEDLMMPVNYYKMPLEYYKVNAPTEGKSKVKLAIMTSDKESIEEIWTCEFDLKKIDELFFNFSEKCFLLNDHEKGKKSYSKTSVEVGNDKLIKKILDASEAVGGSFSVSKEQFATGKSTCLFYKSPSISDSEIELLQNGEFDKLKSEILFVTITPID